MKTKTVLISSQLIVKSYGLSKFISNCRELQRYTILEAHFHKARLKMLIWPWYSRCIVSVPWFMARLRVVETDKKEKKEMEEPGWVTLAIDPWLRPSAAVLPPHSSPDLDRPFTVHARSFLFWTRTKNRNLGLLLQNKKWRI